MSSGSHHPRTPRLRRSAIVAIALVAAGAAVPVGGAVAANKALLQALRVRGDTAILVDSSHRTLYLLSTEESAHLHCTATCLTYWPPILVPKSTAKVSLGPGVKGKIGFVVRNKTMKQVTFNSYPIYRFAGDAGAGKTNGEGLASYGGTWYTIKAAATTAKTTALKTLPSKPTVTGGY